MIEDILARIENYDIRDIHLHDTIACELLRMRDRIAELEIERDDIAASLLKCSEMLILHAKSAGDTIRSLSDKTDNIAKAVFSDMHQTLSEAFQEKIYERDARIAHLERPVTAQEIDAALETFQHVYGPFERVFGIALIAAHIVRTKKEGQEPRLSKEEFIALCGADIVQSLETAWNLPDGISAPNMITDEEFIDDADAARSALAAALEIRMRDAK